LEKLYSTGLDIRCGVLFGIGSCKDKDVVIPYNVKKIGVSAFAHCTSLTSVKMTNFVTSIGSSAFKGCYSLKCITIGSGVKHIGKNAFDGCNALMKVNYLGTLETLKEIDFNEYFSKLLYQIQYNFYINNKLVPYAQLSKVKDYIDSTIIDKDVLKNDSLKVKQETKNLSIKNGVLLSRGSCKNKSILIPSKATHIAENAFVVKEPFSKSSVKIQIGDKWHDGITGVKIPDTIKSIGANAFKDCIFLETFTFCDNSNLQTIGDNTFCNCIKLKEIFIPASVENISNNAFENCKSLEKIIVDINNKNYKSVDGNLYTKDGKTLIKYAPSNPEKVFVLPSRVEKVVNGAFDGCNKLTSILVDKSNPNYKSLNGKLYEKDSNLLVAKVG
jgi:hypothetical protein